ncbi:NAD-P-binding protein [Hymenopellis radicata]|nr:NAD-P-binding protein [Hymenopellis radicata]
MSGFNPSTDLVDLNGKVAIVTGGNKGIGFATVRYLARAGAKVYIAGRDEGRALKAIDEIKHGETVKGEIVWMKLDLCDPHQVKYAARDFLRRETRLDILVNNAAVNNFEESAYAPGLDGMSAMVIINYLSPFVFTQNLLPLLISTSEEPNSDVRIVNLSSQVHSKTPEPLEVDTWDDLNVSYKDRYFPALIRYGHSKLLVILWTKALQDHLSAASKDITLTALHPGVANTFNHLVPFFIRPILNLLLDSPDRGSYNSVFAAAGKAVRDDKEKYKGAYISPGKAKMPSVVEPAKMALDERLRRRLWEMSLEYTQTAGLV